MAEWNELAHFLYGRGFWYADPIGEIRGLTADQLLWVPNPNGMCLLWQVGHIAHRERLHFGVFLGFTYDAAKILSQSFGRDLVQFFRREIRRSRLGDSCVASSITSRPAT